MRGRGKNQIGKGSMKSIDDGPFCDIRELSRSQDAGLFAAQKGISNSKGRARRVCLAKGAAARLTFGGVVKTRRDEIIGKEQMDCGRTNNLALGCHVDHVFEIPYSLGNCLLRPGWHVCSLIRNCRDRRAKEEGGGGLLLKTDFDLQSATQGALVWLNGDAGQRDGVLWLPHFDIAENENVKV